MAERISRRALHRIAEAKRRIVKDEPGVRRLPAHQQALDGERGAELEVMIDADLAGRGAEPDQAHMADLNRPNEAHLRRADVPAEIRLRARPGVADAADPAH